MELSPFNILGIEETDNQDIITSAYRRMILMVHPDKAGKLGWSLSECTEAFQQIKNAYQTIILCWGIAYILGIFK